NTMASTSTPPLRFCRFGSRNRQLQPLRFADGSYRGRSANAVSTEQAMQIVDPVDGLAGERDDDIARLQPRARGRTSRLDRGDQHTAGLHEAMRSNRETRQRHILPTNTDAGATHVSVRDELTDDELEDRKSTRLNSSHVAISYAVFCLKKKKAM